MLDVAHYADNLALGRFASKFDALANRRPRSKIVAGKAFIDDRHRRLTGLILSVQVPAMQQADANGFEETGTGGNHSDLIVLARFRGVTLRLDAGGPSAMPIY